MEKLAAPLMARLETMLDHETVDVLVYITEDDPMSVGEGPQSEALDPSKTESAQPTSRRGHVERIRAHVEERQSGVLNFLRSQETQALSLDAGLTVPSARLVDRYWINNALRVELTRTALMEIAERDDVAHIEMVIEVDTDQLLDTISFSGALGTAEDDANDDVPVPEPTWSVKRVGAPLMWRLGHRGKGVLVAVIDTGVNYNHPDLTERMWHSEEFPNHGYDFSGNGDPNPIDVHPSGHGTACAGIVAGDGQSGRATGVAPEATVMAIKMGSNQAAMFRCLEFAVDQGADVISMSLTWKRNMSPDNPGWRRACDTVASAGVVHANSCGNNGNNLTAFPLPHNIGAPGNCPPPWLSPHLDQTGGTCSVTTCGSSNTEDQLLDTSGRGPAAWEGSAFDDYPYAGGDKPGLFKPDVCAPGSPTQTCSHRFMGTGTGHQPYRSFNGTSSATPHVAGCFALLLSACKAAGVATTPAQLQEALEQSAVKMVGQCKPKENHFGAGRVDVFEAYKYGADKNWWPSAEVLVAGAD